MNNFSNFVSSGENRGMNDANFFPEARNVPPMNFDFTNLFNGFPVANGANQNMMQNMNSANSSTNMNNLSNALNLVDSYEGYTRGNLFAGLYAPYKNYRPMRLVPTNEQAELLLRANELAFASHELRLYLDVYPNDRNAILLFNEYRKSANEMTRKYEEKYGPIEWNALSSSNVFDWENEAWPWEMGVM